MLFNELRQTQLFLLSCAFLSHQTQVLQLSGFKFLKPDTHLTCLCDSLCLMMSDFLEPNVTSQAIHFPFDVFCGTTCNQPLKRLSSSHKLVNNCFLEFLDFSYLVNSPRKRLLLLGVRASSVSSPLSASTLDFDELSIGCNEPFVLRVD